MKVRAILSTLVLCSLAVTLTSCSRNITGPEPPDDSESEQNPPEGFPPIPYPETVHSDIPDSSEIYVTIAPIAGKGVDFAPVWETGRFTWDVDIQTQYERCPLGICRWDGDQPGDYWNGTRHNTALLFEGGTVDLRTPEPFGPPHDPHPKRVQFVQNGEVLSTPFNPERSSVVFQFTGFYPSVQLDGALWGGSVTKSVEPGFGESQRRRAYYVAATAATPLTTPVFLKRERYWKKIPLLAQGSVLQSVTLDPGATFEVSYTWSAGTDYADSYTFTRSVSGEITAGSDKNFFGAKLGGALSQAFTTEVHVTEATSVTVTKTLTGIPDKTTVYTAWVSVERYTIVDEGGNPYTDPNYTFSELGTAVLVGSREQIASKSFPHQP